MEYDIYDLMRGLQDDSVPLPEGGAADLHRIKELTMHKIQENQDGHGARPIRRVTRGLLVAAIAAALCIATVVAAKLGVADSFNGFFGKLTAEEKHLMEEMGTTEMPAPVTSNGATITPIAVYGDTYHYYLRLRIEAPAGTVLRIPDPQAEGELKLVGTEYDGILETTDYDFSGLGYSVSWEDSSPGDNVLEGVLCLEAQMLSDHAALRHTGSTLRFNDGLPKYLHITRLAIGVNDHYTETVLEGDWRFALPDLSAQGAPIQVDAGGLTTASTQPGRTIYLDTFRISSTYIQAKYEYDGTDDFDAPLCEPEGGWALVLDNGTEIILDEERVCGGGFSNSYADLYWLYPAPIDITQVDHIRFGDLTIPVNP